MSYSLSRDPNARNLGSTINSAFAPLFAPPSLRDVAAGQQLQMAQQQAQRQQQAFDDIARFYGPEAAALAAGGQGAYLSAFERSRLGAALPTERRIDLTYDNFANSPTGFTTAQAGLDRRNAADNRRAVATAAIAPLPADAVRPAAPSVASLYGMPELAQPQQGNLTLRPGEVIQTPDTVTPGAAGQPPTVTPGRRFEGNPQTPNRAPFNVVIQSPDGQTIRTAVSHDGVNDTLGQPLIRSPGERIASTFSVQGSNTRDVAAPTNTNITQANVLAAELSAGDELIGAVRGLISTNPGIFGLPGAVRGIAQDIRATLVETMQAFGRDRPDMQQVASNITQGLARVAPEYYDANIPRAQRLLYELAYFSARMNDPNGEVSREEFMRNFEMMRGGMFGNNQRVEAMLTAIEESMNARRAAVGALRAPGAQTTPRPLAAPGPAQTGPDGRPVTAGPGGTGAASPPQAPVRVASPEEARRLPSGTPIILPDGSEGRVP